MFSHRLSSTASPAALPHLPPAGSADEPTLPSQVATPRRERNANGPCCGARHGRMHQAEKHQAGAQVACMPLLLFKAVMSA